MIYRVDFLGHSSELLELGVPILTTVEEVWLVLVVAREVEALMVDPIENNNSASFRLLRMYKECLDL